MAVSAGALKRYLAERGALPERALAAGVGVDATARRCGDEQPGDVHALPVADERRRACRVWPPRARRGRRRKTCSPTSATC